MFRQLWGQWPVVGMVVGGHDSKDLGITDCRDDIFEMFVVQRAWIEEKQTLVADQIGVGSDAGDVGGF